MGAHLSNAAMRGECTVHDWRERNREVDFVRSNTMTERRPMRAGFSTVRGRELRVFADPCIDERSIVQKIEIFHV